MHTSQQNIIIDQLINTDSPHYNIGGYIILNGTLDKKAFNESIATAPAVFDVFRAQFNSDVTNLHVTYQDGYTQLELPALDFSSEADPAGNAIAWMQGRFKIPFQIAAGAGLFEQYLIKISSEEHWFFGRYHHLITDGFGFLVWVQYISRKYRSIIQQESLDFTYPSYQEAAVKAAAYRASPLYEAEATYWTEKIKEKPKNIFQKKYKQQATDVRSAFTFSISTEQKALLQNAKNLSGTGLQQMTLAALLIYFGKTTDQSSFIFGIPVHKRTSKKLRNTLGLFSGILPHVATYDESMAVEDVLAQVNQNLRKDYRHANYLNGDLSRYLKINPVEEYLTEVIVNYQPYNFEVDFGNAIAAKVEILANEVGNNPLQFCWWEDEGNGELELKVNYSTAFFCEAEIIIIIHRLLFIIGQFANNLHNSVKKIEIVPSQEMHLLTSFNQQQLLPDSSVNCMDLFEDQVQNNPTGPAVYFDKQQLSYQQLNERANKVANYLLTRLKQKRWSHFVSTAALK